MEAIAALGLVSNTIQLIDFTAKLISQSASFLQSSSDAIPENLKIRTLVNENRNQIRKILEETGAQTAEEKALHQAAKTCDHRVTDLLSVLDRLMVPSRSDGTRSKRKRVWIALKSQWKRDEVTARRADLEQAQRQLNTALLQFIRSSQASGFDELRTRLTDIDSALALLASKSDIERIINHQSNKLHRLLDSLNARHDHHDAAQERTLQQISQAHVESQAHSKRTAEKVDNLTWAVLDESERRRAVELIQSLKFPDIDARVDMISEAAARTFGWILGDGNNSIDYFDDDGTKASMVSHDTEDNDSTDSTEDLDSTNVRDDSDDSSGTSGTDSIDQSDEIDDDDSNNSSRSLPQDQARTTFEDWLENGTGIFWLSGKAGSGKSTLMKFLQHHRRTRELLTVWADTDPLIVASHFFWHSGSYMQKSHEGLLRSLLYQVFEADIRLIKRTIPDRLRMDGLQRVSRWSRRELARALRNLCNLNIKICLFIDGLDEYNPHHDHEKLIEDISEISKSGNVKLCVSSRPWQIFEDTFRHHNKIKLEDLNKQDIEQFVWDRLSSSAKDPETYRAFQTRSRNSRELVEKITQKSDGVFLWTHLVVHRLSDWLRIGQSLERLDDYVNGFPSELEEYFRKLIFERISPTWKGSSATAQALKLTMIAHATDTLFEEPGGRDEYLRFDRTPLIFYWFLTIPGGLSEARFGEHRPITDVSLDELKAKLRLTRNFLKATWGDLLSISDDIDEIKLEDLENWPAYGRVEFFHRTVSDFLMSDDMQTLIDGNVPRHLGTELFHAQLQLAAAKLILPYFDQRNDWRRYPHIIKSQGTAYGNVIWRDSGFLASALQIATVASNSRLAMVCESVAIAYIDRLPRPVSVRKSEDLWLPECIASNARTLGTFFISQHLHRFTQAKVSVGLNLYPDELRSALGMSNVGTLFRPDGFPLIEIDYDFVRLILQHSVSGRDRCHLFGYDSRSLWDRFLGKWMQEAWTFIPLAESPGDMPYTFEPPWKLSLAELEHAWKITKLLIEHGAFLGDATCLLDHHCELGVSVKSQEPLRSSIFWFPQVISRS
jgi:hypothetical protein